MLTRIMPVRLQNLEMIQSSIRIKRSWPRMKFNLEANHLSTQKELLCTFEVYSWICKILGSFIVQFARVCCSIRTLHTREDANRMSIQDNVSNIFRFRPCRSLTHSRDVPDLFLLCPWRFRSLRLFGIQFTRIRCPFCMLCTWDGADLLFT